MLFSITNKCLEIKKLYNGLERQFLCDLLYLENSFGILQFILEKDYFIDNLLLPKGSISLGFFWKNRSYNVYQWFHNEELIATYFNISDSTELSREKFIWRDLILDVLIPVNSIYRILDQEELKAIHDKEILTYITKAKNQIIQDHEQIIIELNDLTLKHELLK